MGGTGGPGSDRASAQSGLQGAGLLVGDPNANTKMQALGIENVPQPSSGLLAGGVDSAMPIAIGPRSASDTPVPMAPDVVAQVPASSGLVQAPVASGGFQLASPSHLNFSPVVPPAVTPPVTDVKPPIAGGPAAASAAEAPKPATPEQLWDEWYKAHPGTGYTMSLDDFLAYDLGERSDLYAIPGWIPERGSWEAPGPARTPEQARILAQMARRMGQPGPPSYDPRITSG